MTTWEYPCTGPVDVHVGIAAGTVTVVAEPTDVATVAVTRTGWGAGDRDIADDVRVSFTGDMLQVSEQQRIGLRFRNHGFDVLVTIPPGSGCHVSTAAADITCRGEVGALDVSSASGNVRSELVGGPADLTTLSGTILLESGASTVAAKTASGKISLASVAGDVTVNSASGDASIGTAGGSVTARTASGRVRIGVVSQGDAEVSTVSGDIEVGVAPGTGVYLDASSLSGRVSSDLVPEEQSPGGAALRVRCRSMSGGVRITRAVPADHEH